MQIWLQASNMGVTRGRGSDGSGPLQKFWKPPWLAPFGIGFTNFSLIFSNTNWSVPELVDLGGYLPPPSLTENVLQLAKVFQEKSTKIHTKNFKSIQMPLATNNYHSRKIQDLLPKLCLKIFLTHFILSNSYALLQKKFCFWHCTEMLDTGF